MADFHLLITDWYRLNQRSLPWRETSDPYLIWLSEIILQQTRVDQGMNYYLRFAEKYPTATELANADEQDVLKLWQGLGYYSRARNLHAAAKTIRDRFNGSFPHNFTDIRSLKGVGDYTAAAIASFAFGLPHAVVDGNVYRLLSRYFDIDLPIDSAEGKKYFAELASELLNPENAAIHNQAIMEMGALVCKPAQPDCEHCPLSSSCLARVNGTIQLRPVKGKKTKVKNRYFTYLVFNRDNKTFLEKRSEKDIWQHLYQFPLIESEQMLNEEEIRALTGLDQIQLSEPITHILSHQKIQACFAHVDNFKGEPKENWTEVSIDNLDQYPLPRLIDRYLERNGING